MSHLKAYCLCHNDQAITSFCKENQVESVIKTELPEVLLPPTPLLTLATLRPLHLDQPAQEKVSVAGDDKAYMLNGAKELYKSNNYVRSIEILKKYVRLHRNSVEGHYLSYRV
jgi:hypothetical protein